MTKKILALVLSLCMMLSVCSGCGSSTQNAESTADSETSSAASSVEEAVEEASEDETEEAEVVEEAEEAEEAEEPEAPAVTISYPLGSDITLTFWTAFDSNAFGDFGLSSYNALEALAYVQEKTGVGYEYVEVSNFSASEQFNLMIASGDWCDAMQCSKYYTGGLSQAYADGVIADLTDMLAEYAPDYYAKLMERDQTTLENIRTAGRDLMLVSMFDDYINDGGTFVRGDWLEALGVEWPTTFDGFIDLLYQVQAAYGCEYTYPADPGAGISGAEAYFGSELFSLRTDGSDLAIYVDNGTVYSGVTSDGYREYLELLIQLYADGIINKEFYVSELDRGSTMGYVGDGNIFIWSGRADTINDALSYTTDENMSIMPVTTYFVGESGVYDFLDEVVYANTDGLSITTACEDIGLALSFYNYFYTDEGAVLCNYGLEDVGFTYDSNGNPQYTDMILNNPDGMNFNTALVIYGISGVVTLTNNNAKLTAYTDEVVNAIEVFSSLEGTSSEHTYPNGAALSSAESDSIANQITDIVAYATEQCLKFVVGAEELNDESWASYVAYCNSVGLEDCVAVYQQAYDNYLAG